MDLKVTFGEGLEEIVLLAVRSSYRKNHLATALTANISSLAGCETSEHDAREFKLAFRHNVKTFDLVCEQQIASTERQAFD